VSTRTIRSSSCSDPCQYNDPADCSAGSIESETSIVCSSNVSSMPSTTSPDSSYGTLPSMSAPEPPLCEKWLGLRIDASMEASMSASSETSVTSAGTSTQSSQVTADEEVRVAPTRVELPRDDVDLLRVGEQRRTLAACDRERGVDLGSEVVRDPRPAGRGDREETVWRDSPGLAWSSASSV
jgi:hypothetical protein